MEEQPRKLESVITVSQTCLHQTLPQDIPKEVYVEQAQDLVFNENVLLQTLGFDVAVDHPHTHVVKTCDLVKGMIKTIDHRCDQLVHLSANLSSLTFMLFDGCVQPVKI